jgi:hypothetical protein
MEPQELSFAQGLYTYYRLDRQQMEKQANGVMAMVWKPIQCYASLDEVRRARYELLRYDPNTSYRVVKTIDEEIDMG